MPSHFALNIYLKQKCALACREVFPLSETGKVSLDGPSFARGTFTFSCYMSSSAKILIPAKRDNALPYVSYPPIFFSIALFLVFLSATSKAVEGGERPPTNATSTGERNISSFRPLFASISTSSTKIEMQGNWKMESTLSGDSFVPFVRGFRVENGFELEN